MLNRRSFLASSAAGAAALPAAAQAKRQQYIELRFYDLHNDQSNQRQRLTDFFEKAHLPMMKKRGVSSIGYFQVYLGPDMPKIVTVTAWPSLAALESVHNGLAGDQDWQATLRKHSGAAPLFDRTETWLLQAFEGMPEVGQPSAKEDGSSHIFLLRIYESVSYESHLRKVDMFNSGGEIDIFLRTGLNPLLFGSTLYGGRMPNLVYMLWFDDMAAHDAAWDKFRAHPDWKKISSDPKWAGTVSNISNIVLTPLPFSPIR